MAKKPNLGAGNVEIELDGEPYVLKPTLRAARTISQQSGGFMGAMERIGKLDLDAFIQVITLGLNASGQEAKEIPEKVWSTGMPALSEPVIRYLSNLANGGRPVDDNGGEEEGNPPSE